ncbi:hypothetical protein [Georgenia daeguensis]|uniref:4'-phosphopantetheinyl transferase superfamily protein n=1 Tax=Georgenia daeguensis TaxID=908355 RepID=A0ABP8EW45_9MICO
MAEVWWSSLAAADRDLLAVLDDTERARVESLERPADRGRSLLGAALLRAAVAARLGTDPAQVVVDRTCTECGAPHGAPRIVRPGTAVPWVSVSHSGLLVVVALSGHGPVGVDVQRESDLPGPDAGRDWVRREAAFKATTTARRDGHAAARWTADAVAAATVDLRPPLAGYAAALAMLGESDGLHACHRWPGDRTAA